MSKYQLLPVLAILLASLTINQKSAIAQELPYFIEWEAVSADDAPALHSFAIGEYDGKWLMLAGRTNGLHGFPPMKPFPPEMANNNIWVMDPATGESWSSSLDLMPDSIANPFRSTNTQWAQKEDALYVMGGYGYDNVADNFKTWPTLSRINVPAMIDSVIAGGDLLPTFTQIEDSLFKVTGGEMKVMGNKFYLVFGHDFDGVYTRNGQTFTQHYIEEVRIFEFTTETLGIASFEKWEHETEFHRRDLTVAPIMYSDESAGIAAYGGVFKPDEEAPYLYPIFMDENGAQVDSSYEQIMSQYTCPAVPVFSATSGEMFTTFFGGISVHYADDDGNFIFDHLAPFIDEVTTFKRSASSENSEVLHDTRLPSLWGSNAVFMIDHDVPAYENHVIKLDQLNGRTKVGYLYGGIEAAQPNFTPSSASNSIFEVYITPRDVSSTENDLPAGFLVSEAYPNPTTKVSQFSIQLAKPELINIALFDLLGRKIATIQDEKMLTSGTHFFEINLTNQPAGVYLYRITGDTFSTSKSIIKTD